MVESGEEEERKKRRNEYLSGDSCLHFFLHCQSPKFLSISPLLPAPPGPSPTPASPLTLSCTPECTSFLHYTSCSSGHPHHHHHHHHHYFLYHCYVFIFIHYHCHHHSIIPVSFCSCITIFLTCYGLVNSSVTPEVDCSAGNSAMHFFDLSFTQFTITHP